LAVDDQLGRPGIANLEPQRPHTIQRRTLTGLHQLGQHHSTMGIADLHPARIARQQLRESLDRRRRFDGWMLVLLGAAISAWAHAVVQLVNRTSAP